MNDDIDINITFYIKVIITLTVENQRAIRSLT